MDTGSSSAVTLGSMSRRRSILVTARTKASLMSDRFVGSVASVVAFVEVFVVGADTLMALPRSHPE